MLFHHEKLTVYQRALEFASWSQDLIQSLTKRTFDQLGRRIAEDSVVYGKRANEVEEVEED